jgi:hypothetical protein
MHQNAQKSKHFLSPTSSMGYAAQGYQSSSSRLPVKIPILICSMVLHAYLFFSALKKIRQLRVQSIIPVGCKLETEGYMTLPRASPSVINFQNLHVKKGLVSHAHEIHALWIPSTKLPIPISPPEKVKAII